MKIIKVSCIYFGILLFVLSSLGVLINIGLAVSFHPVYMIAFTSLIQSF